MNLAAIPVAASWADAAAALELITAGRAAADHHAIVSRLILTN